MYFGVDSFIQMIFFFIISSIFAIFSPLGIGFIIFSIVRIKTESDVLKKTSLIFQIICSALTFIGGILIGLLITFRTSYYGYGHQFYMPSLEQLLPGLCIFFGVSFIVLIQVIIIFWEGSWLKNNTDKKPAYRR